MTNLICIMAALIAIESDGGKNLIGKDRQGNEVSWGQLHITRPLLSEFNDVRLGPPFDTQDLVRSPDVSTAIFYWHVTRNEATNWPPEHIALLWHLGRTGLLRYMMGNRAAVRKGNAYLEKFRKHYKEST